ncbi:unnamed protein product [Miscanthus lutarioriparius]|uniref:Uncharacterized protein n=1 Tax=Miscanthus lutarioriparius TaxID=422564 RepID=A0A811NBU5_9POAL|nr:unnamed protein product [Miscanthus lutarioriparius]
MDYIVDPPPSFGLCGLGSQKERREVESLTDGSRSQTWRSLIGSSDVAAHPDWLLHRGLGQVRASAPSFPIRRSTSEKRTRARDRTEERESDREGKAEGKERAQGTMLRRPSRAPAKWAPARNREKRSKAERGKEGMQSGGGERAGGSEARLRGKAGQSRRRSRARQKGESEAEGERWAEADRRGKGNGQSTATAGARQRRLAPARRLRRGEAVRRRQCSSLAGSAAPRQRGEEEKERELGRGGVTGARARGRVSSSAMAGFL